MKWILELWKKAWGKTFLKKNSKRDAEKVRNVQTNKSMLY